MQLPDLKGKKKADLAILLELAGIMSQAEALKLKKQQMVDILLAAEKEASEQQKEQVAIRENPEVQPEQTIDQPEVKKTAKRGRKRKILPENIKVAIHEIAPPKTDTDDPAPTNEIVDSSTAKETEQEKGCACASVETDVLENETTVDCDGKEDENKEDKRERKRTDNQEEVEGVLEIMPDGYGFLRRDNYLQSAGDTYVSPQFIRRFHLRCGDYIKGVCRTQRDNDRYRGLCYIHTINDLPFEKNYHRPRFERLTPIYPNERYTLETTRTETATRIIDLVAPIGKGQRAMIVSPPKAGKTILMQKIANAISHNNPDTKLIVLLIDERPEEVTDMQRSIEGEVVYSTFDKTAENHVKVTELVLERAMRLVELGQDVVILLDSITRMARAYNLTINPTGRTLSGGLDPGALYGPKRFFGAARNIENGGSLTIIATALVDTGSRMDEVIFEEFKGTGNQEIYLDRKLAEKRVFPALDLMRSGTRREELLLSGPELNANWAMRKAFASSETAVVTDTIVTLLKRTEDNEQFIATVTSKLNKQGIVAPTPNSDN